MGTHLSTGSVDSVEVLVGSTWACNRVEDVSVAHLLLNVVAVELADNQKLIGSHG